jgi:TolA-binding protein
MKYRSLLVCVLLAAPAIAPGANKEIQELQRDIGQLEQRIRDLQRSQDEKFTAVLDLARQALEASNRANAGVLAVTSNMEKTLGPLKESLAGPIAGLNSKLDAQGNDVRALQQAVGELSATMARMQSQLNEIKDLVKSGQQAPVPPAPAATPTGQPSSLPDAPSASVSDLYGRALGDYRSGKYDLAVDGFNELLKFYPNDKLAPNAQYYIGLVYYGDKKNYDKALEAFSAVLTNYIANPKTPEARLYKGRALIRLGRRNEGVVEFRQLLKDDPKGEAAKMGCEELKDLGMNCTAPGAANRPPATRKK